MKNRYFLLLIFAVALITQACSSDSGTIVAGQVIEAGTGNAVDGAIVEITEPVDLQESTTTDSTGNFSFSVNVDETATVTLEVSKQNFETATRNFKLSSGNDVDDLVIELTSSTAGDGGDDSDDTIGGDSGPPAALELTSISSSNIAVKGTGGDVSAKFTFSVTDSAGRPVDQGYNIDFSIITGPGGGEYVQPATATTSSQGTVSSVINAGTQSGVIKLQASAGSNIASTPVLVAVGNGFPQGDNFRIAPTNINFEAWGLLASSQNSVKSNYVAVSLGDNRNNPVLPGTAVDFTTTAGNITASAVTDEKGVAIAELIPDGSRPGAASSPIPVHPRGIGWATVTARTVAENDNYVTVETDVLFTSSSNISINLYDPGTTTPATISIPSNGSQSFDLVIEDVNGYPIPAGSEMEVTSSTGTSNTFGTLTQGDHTSAGQGTTRFSFSVTDSDDQNPTEQNASIDVTITFPSENTATRGFQ
ncbi:carboxypeptidase regulatory-like domain-containing protein [Fodinibius salinus]|nr:carboxypeptidase regulatory-like domain-containing protein [Fodinibius salinus]